MPSSIVITTALKDACSELLGDLSAKAEAHAVDVEYHVVSTWASALLQNANRLSAAAVAAQVEFSMYPLNKRWLDALENLLLFGGEGADDFVVTLCRYYLFDLPQVEELLWQQYSSLGRKVTLETSRQLADSWGEWDGPIRALFNQFAEHLRREDSTYDLLFNTPTARQLVDGVPTHMLPPGPEFGIPAGPVDDTAALTTYLEWCLEQFGRLEADGSRPGERFGLRLADVFVPRQLNRVDDWAEVRSFVRYQLIARRLQPAQGRAPPRASEDGNPPAPGPIIQLLDRVVRLLIFAGPGEGKTTLLRHLALQYASLTLAEQSEPRLSQRARDENHRVPIYLHVADYAENANIDQESLLDYALRTLAENELRDPGVPGMLRHLLEQGRCLILLDGMDSVLGDYPRRMVAVRISQLAVEWCATSEANRILVATRPAGFQTAPLSPDFAIYSLAKLSRKEINEALMRWFLAIERARRPMLADDALQRQAEQATIGVLREISTGDSLRAMASVPLLLRLMAERHQEGAYLSHRRVGLLQAAADATIREWRLARGPAQTPSVQQAEVTDLLGHLAYWLQDTRSSGIASEREAVERLASIWLGRHLEANENDAREAITEFLAKVRHHGGLLAEVRPRRYAFIHPSMQEYFAARHLVRRLKLADERIRPHLHDSRWSHVIRLAVGFIALGSASDASDLLDSAILAWPSSENPGFAPSPFEDILKRDLLFAASLLADGVEARPNLTRTIVQQLVDLWIHGDRDSVGRFDAVLDQVRRLLIALDGTAAGQVALSIALGYAEDERAPVRAFLADSLTFWPSQVPLVLQSLVNLGRDKSATVRRAAGEAFGRAGELTPEAQVVLLSMVSDSDTQVREVARRALKTAGPVPPSAMKVWVRLLRDDDPGKRQLGAKVLQRVGTLPPLVVGELLALLSDEDLKVRTTVAATLSEIDVLPDDALVAICRAIDQATSDVKVAGIHALARPVELPEDVLAQVAHWSQEPDGMVRLAATSALDACQNPEESVIDALLNRTGDNVLNVRQLAIEALGRKGKGNRRVAHMLQHFATETNPGVKISAARAFGYLQELSSEAEGYLADLVSDFHAGVRGAAMEAVERLGKPYEKIVPRLVDMTTGDRSEEAVQAAHTLAALDRLPPDVLLAMVDLLPDHPDELAEPVAACLRRHSPLPAEVAYPLMGFATEGPPQIRSLTIQVLGGSIHAVPGVLEVLLELAADPDMNVCAEAVTSLGNARDLSDRAVDTMFDMLEEGPLPIRQAAAVTLTKLSRALPHLGWDDRRMETIADHLYRLLQELPPRASWEPDVGGQNAVYEAIRSLASRYRPEV
jgi:HEAT repeat protein